MEKSAQGTNVDYTVPASKRGIDMLLAKYYNREYETEVSTKPGV